MEYLTPDQFKKKVSKYRSNFDIEIFKARQNIANELRRFFKASFSSQGFNDRPWAERRTGGNWPIFNKSSGRMEANIDIINNLDDIIEVGIPDGSSSQFAMYHNDPEGGSGVTNTQDTGRFTSRNNAQTWKRNQYTDKPIERRQFIGFSDKLEVFTINEINEALERALK